MVGTIIYTLFMDGPRAVTWLQPSGPARHDPSSPEWVAILTEQQEKKRNVAPKRKNTSAQTKEVPAKKNKKANKENTLIR